MFLNNLTKNLISQKIFSIFLLSICLASPSIQAQSINSNSGNINFDSDNNSNNEMSISADGLGIGTSSPAANLHVSGNGIVSNKLVVGDTTNTSSSTLHIAGTLGFSVQSLTAGSNVIDRSVVLADSSSGNVFLILPAPDSTVGSVITIKRVSTLNEINLSGGGGNIEGSTSVINIGAGNLSYITLVNTGTGWTFLNTSEPIDTSSELAGSNVFLWWALNETSGNSVNDSSNSGRGANLTNDLLFSGNSVTGPLNGALHIDEWNDTVLSDNLTYPDKGYTYALWSKYSRGSEDDITFQPEISGPAGFVWASSNAFIHKSAYHQLSDNTYVTTQLTSTLSANTWYHMAVTWNGGNVSLYLNGNLQSGNAAASWSGNVVATSNVELTNPGLVETDQYYADDLRVYDYALKAEEVLILYGTGNPNP